MLRAAFRNIALSIFIWIMTAAMTVAVFIVAVFLVIMTYPFDKKRKFVHAQGFWWAEGLIRFNPYWDFSISGLENVDYNKTYVIVANHQSFADIVMVYRTHLQFKWVAKNSLFFVPVFGWCMSMMKYIRLKRGDYGSTRKLYRQATEWLRQGVSVLFFPEGTRSSDETINTFKNGAFKLAIKEKIPVLPVYIEGSRGVIPKGTWIFKHHTSCRLKVLPEIDTADFAPGDFVKLREATYRSIASVSTP